MISDPDLIEHMPTKDPESVLDVPAGFGEVAEGVVGLLGEVWDGYDAWQPVGHLVERALLLLALERGLVRPGRGPAERYRLTELGEAVLSACRGGA